MTGSTFTDTYTLPRDRIESSRLEQQHRIVTTNAGFILHPAIAKSLPNDARIADIATGTGIWMKDVASTAPAGWTFTGFDLSDGQFPPENERAGCSYEVLNILEPLPNHLENSFDVVHVRYLICALTTKDWPIVANNLFKMLKPGGHLQWFESNFGQLSVLNSKPGASTKSMKQLYRGFRELCHDADKLLPHHIDPGLRQNVEKAGFLDVHEDIFSSDRVAETRRDHNAVGMQALRFGSHQAIAQRKGWKHDVKWIDEMYEGAMKEAEDGAYVRWDMHVVIARKPST